MHPLAGAPLKWQASWWAALSAACWLAVATPGCGQPGDDFANSCTPPSTASSGPAYCGGICYLEYCCTEGHPDCPPLLPQEGDCCGSVDMRCSYGCGDGEWRYAAWCPGDSGSWVVGRGGQCDYTVEPDGGVRDVDAGD
jgi:hypothetical protein